MRTRSDQKMTDIFAQKNCTKTRYKFIYKKNKMIRAIKNVINKQKI